MSLQGASQLRARIAAIKQSFKPIGRKWAETTVQVAQPRLRHRTGKGARSWRLKNSTLTRATVAAIYYMAILDKNTKAYDIKPRKADRLVFTVGDRTVFAKQVHRPARVGDAVAPWAARESLRRHPMAEQLIAQWNAAA